MRASDNSLDLTYNSSKKIIMSKNPKRNLEVSHGTNAMTGDEQTEEDAPLLNQDTIDYELNEASDDDEHRSEENS